MRAGFDAAHGWCGTSFKRSPTCTGKGMYTTVTVKTSNVLVSTKGDISNSTCGNGTTNAGETCDATGLAGPDAKGDRRLCALWPIIEHVGSGVWRAGHNHDAAKSSVGAHIGDDETRVGADQSTHEGVGQAEWAASILFDERARQGYLSL